jgi:RNA polymerase sigma-70 factor (ECF subfamily)
MATAIELEAHRAALRGHCYRMLGGTGDADDAVQETMVRAWRSLAGFDGRSSLRTWLYRIATNVCLDALGSRARRERPIESEPRGTVEAELIERPRTHWLEPIPDASVLPPESDPAERAALRQSIRLAFVAALQHLPPKQRAVLLLTQVLGWSAAEVAAGIDTTVPSVNSALQRARTTLSDRGVTLDTVTEAKCSDTGSLVDRFVDAFERYDIDALTTLLRDDATLSMPPYTLWLQGREVLHTWLLGRGAGCRGSRLIQTTSANGAPAFAQYRRNEDGTGYHPWSLIVLELDGPRIASMTNFLDTTTIFPRFGMPLEFDARLMDGGGGESPR